MEIKERKIGEIFDYSGEWYQCVEHKGCPGCAFLSHDNCGFNGDSHCVYRSDSKHVIFKKLEKVGEPYEFDGHQFQSYRTFEVPIFTENYATVRELGNNSKISIEIKQNKEDMEEKKLNLKPFDLQKAIEGKPVYTRDGRKARIVCFDRINARPILALVRSTDGKGEDVFDYFVNGKRIANALESDLDLMMLPEKRTGWINIYNADTTFYYVDGRVFETKDEAVQEAKEEVEKEQREKNEYIDTIRVEWEE